MTYFAKLNQKNIVVNVIEIDDFHSMDENGDISEEIGIEYLQSTYGEETQWKLTLKDGSFRVRFAESGHIYNESYDAFIPAVFFASWTFNLTTLDWDPPTPCPWTKEMLANNQSIKWNEDNYRAGISSGWEIVNPEESDDYLNNYVRLLKPL
jgi:hypothetical protein